jgi:hypothetical protein
MDKEARSLLGLFLLSSVAIAAFYGAGLMYGRGAHLALAEYWRWWVVHLWVEGFFEVFATVVIAFLFVRLKLLEVRKATVAVFFSTIVFLAGGIIGTFHHLYFTGTPEGVLALGAVFSALEVVPLVLVGLEVWQNLRLARAKRAARARRRAAASTRAARSLSRRARGTWPRCPWRSAPRRAGNGLMVRRGHRVRPATPCHCPMLGLPQGSSAHREPAAVARRGPEHGPGPRCARQANVLH